MQQRGCKTSTNRCTVCCSTEQHRAVTKQRLLHAACQPASMSSVPPPALCHSVKAGYTLCLFVIPSDSAGAWGQTCNPGRSLHKQAPRTQKTHQLQFRFCLSLSSLSFALPLALHISLCSTAVKWPMVQPFSVHRPVFWSLPTAFVYQQHNVT